MTGAADTTLVLTKRTGDGGCVLYGRGRDLAEFELAVEFNTDTCRWGSLGEPGTAFASETKRSILDAIQFGHQKPIKISEASGLDYELTKKTLQRMGCTRRRAEDKNTRNGQKPQKRKHHFTI